MVRPRISDITVDGKKIRPGKGEVHMNDFRQIFGPFALVMLAGTLLIFGQMSIDQKSDARSGRPAIAVASLH